MRGASTATQALLKGRQYVLAELYTITLNGGSVLRFTSFQVPLTCAIYPSGSQFTYQTGLTIVRDTFTQKVGTEAGNMKVAIYPRLDSPNYPVLFAGYPIQQAARYGFLDGAKVQLSKLFMPIPTNGILDTSSGAVAWFLGAVQEAEGDRFMVELTIDDYLAYLANQQMPKVLFQAGCWHQLFDAGCTLSKASFTSTGTVATSTDGAHVTTSLTQVDGYFKLGVMTMTSGINNGLAANVASFAHTSGAIVLRFPFPQACGVGDTFSILPGCDKQQATCANSNTAVGPPFNNQIHFPAVPYTPVPETTLDGGTDVPPVQTRGATAGQIIGSAASSAQAAGRYTT